MQTVQRGCCSSMQASTSCHRYVYCALAAKKGACSRQSPQPGSHGVCFASQPYQVTLCILSTVLAHLVEYLCSALCAPRFLAGRQHLFSPAQSKRCSRGQLPVRMSTGKHCACPTKVSAHDGKECFIMGTALAGCGGQGEACKADAANATRRRTSKRTAFQQIRADPSRILVRNDDTSQCHK